MIVLHPDLLYQYRAKTFRYLPGAYLKSKQEAIDYVNERGFIFFWPITNMLMPSLWTAVAGNRPVADAHDDPGHVTWSWKDSLLGERVWYYAKILRKKATIISLEALPYFYALSENYGSPEEDYLTLYEQGRLTQESKVVYEAILNSGPLDTIALRKAARMTSQESDNRFNRALADLQADFKILPIGVAEVGSWNYAFIYELTPRHFPDLIDRTRPIQIRQARIKLTELYTRSVGAFQPRHLSILFQWRPVEIQRTLDHLIETGVLSAGFQVEGSRGEWFVLSELAS